MSDMINHFLCGESALGLVKDKRLGEALEKQKKFFLLGCLGADLFFYYHVLPWKNDAGIGYIGNRFHQDFGPDLLFEQARYYLLKLEDEEEYGRAFAYTMGFIAHHGLDANTHPFINCFSGIYKKEAPDSERHHFRHKRFEILLDMYHPPYLGIEAPDYSWVFQLDQGEVHSLSGYWNGLMSELMQTELPEQVFAESLQDNLFVLRFSLKNPGMKMKVFNRLESWLKRPLSITRVIMEENPGDSELDVMNLENRMWVDPCDRNMFSDYSYPELFQKGVKETAEHMDAFNQSLVYQGSVDMHSIFHGLGFDTGCNDHGHNEIRYCMSVFYGRELEEIK